MPVSQDAGMQPIAGKPAPTGIALGLTGVCHKVWQRLLERAPSARRNRELRSLLVCCDWPGGRSYSRQAEEALPGRPIAPEGRVCP